MQSSQKQWLKMPCLLLAFFACLTPTDRLYAQLNEGPPDTLTIGAYLLIVERYDRGGSQLKALPQTWQHLNGVGHIVFNCSRQLPHQLFTATGDDPVLNKTLVKAGPQASFHTEVATNMPPAGVRVQFTDLTVKASHPTATRGLVTAGTAQYPGDIPENTGPFVLNVAPGFQLQVSAITIFPNQNAVATAQLILPASLAKYNSEAEPGLNLGDISLSPECEFYKELPASVYGQFGVGATTLRIQGRGYVVDFSKQQTYAPSGKPVSWKGVALLTGTSPGLPGDSVISNTGYLQANYSFTQALVEGSGLTATFNNTAPYHFGTMEPLGYHIAFDQAEVKVAACKVIGGFLQGGTVSLPRAAVRQVDDGTVELKQLALIIRPSMDLIGAALVPQGTGLYWGDLVAAGGADRKSFGIENIGPAAWLFFAATPRPVFQPVDSIGKSFAAPFTAITLTTLDSFNIQGATFPRFAGLVVNTPDIPGGNWKPNDPVKPWTSNPMRFVLTDTTSGWLNVVAEGVHCKINSPITNVPGRYKLGDPANPLYVGNQPFNTEVINRKEPSSIIVQCVESAVITCDFRSFINQPKPVSTVLAFKEMVFTSTANNAGGKVTLDSNSSLTHWGLKLIPKQGFDNAGLVSVKTGQIILTATGFAEERHFAQPFWVTWGEMLADGSMGRLCFDYNEGGQQFDGFPFVHNEVALSPYTPTNDTSYLRVGGMAHFPFFGGNYLHIQDFQDKNAAAPFYKRRVLLVDSTVDNFLPTDSTLEGNWSDGLGIFHFTLGYNKVAQDGFIGNGSSTIKHLLGGDIVSTLDMNKRGACIRIGNNSMDERSIGLGSLANVSNINKIWGCACIKNNSIESIVVGGEVTNTANASLYARAGTYLSSVLQITPSLKRLTIDGEAYLSLVASVDVVANGHMQFTLNSAQNFLEGELQGKIRTASGLLNSLEGEGQLNWHLGADFQELQGMISMKIMNTGGSSGKGAAFYAAQNAPKSRAWVLMGSDPRYNLNMAALPNELTGLYGAVHVHEGVNFYYLASGEYDVYVGVGAFVLTPEQASVLGGVLHVQGLPYVLGNLGGRIHGDILGGLLSASAYFNLQLMGPYPFSFEGTVGLEGCALWVACKTVEITLGLNTSQGFYIEY